jgi:hypothetical protein
VFFCPQEIDEERKICYTEEMVEHRTDSPEDAPRATTHVVNGNAYEKKEIDFAVGIQATHTVMTSKESEEQIADISLENLKEEMFRGVHGLPERLAGILGTVDPGPYLKRADELREALAHEDRPEEEAKLQQQLIFQYMSIISRVQNGGDRAITPALAEETKGLDCSLSGWCLQEKLRDVPNLECKIGNPVGHVVNIITLANGQTLYADAQNGFMSSIEWKEVKDPACPDTASPIYEVDESKTRRIACELPDGSTTLMVRPDGCDYTPKHFDVSEDGLRPTIGNFHMLLSPTSPIFGTEAAERFRAKLGIPAPSEELTLAFRVICPASYERFRTEGKSDDDAQKFILEALEDQYPQLMDEATRYADMSMKAWEPFKNTIVNSMGKNSIYETKYGEIASAHHAAWQAARFAEETLWSSIGKPPGNMRSFPEALQQSVRTLPRYQKADRELSNIKPVSAYEIFKCIKRSADDKNQTADADGPRDGVLVASMQSGRLECAGRVLIAAELLKKHGIKAGVIMAPGHSMLLAETDEDTLAYIDANNDLYFTFPKTALDGFENVDSVSECRISAFEPRSKDTHDGIGSVFRHFVVTPSSVGTVRQYLDNTQSALNGGKDFETSGVKTNVKAAAALEEWKKSLGLYQPVIEQYNERTETLQEEAHRTSDAYRSEVIRLSVLHADRAGFVEALSSAIEGKIGDAIPYVQRANVDVRKAFAENIWDAVQSQKTEQLNRLE